VPWLRFRSRSSFSVVQACTHMTSLEQLPSELLGIIFSYIPSDIHALACQSVSTKFLRLGKKLFNQKNFTDKSQQRLHRMSVVLNKEWNLMSWVSSAFKYPGLSHFNSSEILSLAKGDNLEALQKMFAANGSPEVWNNKDLSFYATHRGDFEMLKFLRQIQCPFHAHCAMRAARQGYYEVMQWLLTQQCCPLWSFTLEFYRIKAPDVDGDVTITGFSTTGKDAKAIADFCLKRSIEWVALTPSVRGDDIETLKYISPRFESHVCALNRLQPEDLRRLTCVAAEGAAWRVLFWLREEKNVPFHDQVAYKMILSNASVDVLKRACSLGLELTQSSFYAAVRLNRVDVCLLYDLVRVAKSAAWSQCAAEGKVLETLQWLHSKQFPFDAKTFARAVMKPTKVLTAKEQPKQTDTLTILKWLRSIHCPWDKQTFVVAIEHGCSMEILEWLVAEKCPLDSSVAAAASFKIDTLRFLIQNGCPLSDALIQNLCCYPPQRKLLAQLKETAHLVPKEEKK